MARPKPILACDCETDPFLKQRRPEPFIWGLYDGEHFYTFDTTIAFVTAIKDRKAILYAHNGGRFDFMFLLPYALLACDTTGGIRVQIISNRIISMNIGACELRDSYAIIPVPLRDLGGKKEIEYWKLEKENRVEHATEIKEYLYYDCKSLYDAVVAYRKAAGKAKTIASNALAFSKDLGIDPGKTNHRFDARMRPFYFGGRTECFKPGTHRNLTILDIRSAYPFAMQHFHATGSNFRYSSDFGNLTKEEIQRSFIVLECTSEGAFPLRSGTSDGLIFPHEYNEYYVTGWEYLTAKELGLMSNEKIVSVAHSVDTISFAEYVEHWYKFKSAHPKKTDPINYTIGKIMMNSLYGKLAQNPARYFDYKIVPGGTKICRTKPVRDKETKKYVCGDCGKPLEDHEWRLAGEYENHEIHKRESLWRWRFNYGIEWKSKNIYKNVATGASITGFTRAHLLRAMHAIGKGAVIYCDTDGIVCTSEAEWKSLPISPALGDWEIEDQNAPIGHFAGKKLYGIELSTGKYKCASKGARLVFSDYEKLVNGETVVWENDAPSFSIDGKTKFIVRDIRATAHTT